MKKSCIIFMCVVMLFTMLVGCTKTDTESSAKSPTQAATPPAQGSSGSKTVITALRPGDETKVRKWSEQAIETFNADNPDIELKFIYEGWGGWVTTYPTMMASDTQPEVIFWYDNQLKDSAIADKLVNLEEYMDPKILSLYPKSVLEIGRMDGKLLYLAQSVDPGMVFYRKDIFEQAGLDPNKRLETWDEFAAACKQIYEKTGIPALGFQGKPGLLQINAFVANFYHSYTGKPWMDEKNQPLFNTPEGLEAIKMVENLLQYAQDGIENYGRGELRPMLRDGKVAMHIDSSWTVPDLQAAFGENLDQSVIGVMPIPSAGKGKNAWVNTNGWVITRKSVASEAARVVNFFASEEQVYLHHTAYGNAPLLEYEKKQSNFQYGFWDTFSEVINNYNLFVQIGANHPTPNAFFDEFEAVWQQLFMGKIDAQTALDLCEEATNKLNRQAGIE
ncbi:MAG TPA: sugar ABC transporter substrate-binding protein [Clostridia bacterium]